MGETRIHPHAATRAHERGTTDAEMIATVTSGESFPAKHGRTGFRRNFPGPWVWRGKSFDTRQVEVYAVLEDGEWLVITALVKYF